MIKPVEELRSAVDIVKVIGASVKLRKSGANFMGLCPFHQEKTPSFAVHPEKQIFHCFGCGVGGDVFKFVMLLENVTFPESVERVAEIAGVMLPERWKDGHEDPRAKDRAALLKINEAAARFFSSQLQASSEGRAALGYLHDRGLSGETLARFRIGYAPADGGALPLHLSKESISAEMMERAGLAVAGSDGRKAASRFRRRIIFPIADESGRVIAFAGRSLGDDLPKYLNSPETPLYSKSRILYHFHDASPEIRRQDIAVLVEGYMDCIALASNGVPNVVASCGTSLTTSQVRLLARSTRRIVVNFDPDAAGVSATERSLEMLLEEGFEVRVLSLPGGLDPDSFVRRRGAEEYKAALTSAPAYMDYLTERAVAKHGLTTPEGKVRAASEVLPYLSKVGSPLLRDEMAHRLSERLRIDDAILRHELKRAAEAGRKQLEVKPEAAVKPTVAEKDLLRAFLNSPELAGEFLQPLLEEGLTGGLPTASLFKKIMAEYAECGRIDPSRFEKSVSPAELAWFFEAQFESGLSPDRARVITCCQALKRRKIEQERTNLQADIERAERNHDDETLRRLLEAKLEITRSLARLGGG
ncbi:MAG: DNA primase [Acidobacteriota bacterium]|nr:DNA primase [Acidobacteriota bacterium]